MAKSDYEIQDSGGNWTPYTGTGSGNIRKGGTTYSNYSGQQAYNNEADPSAAPPPADAGPIPTNPDGSQVGSGTPWEGDHPTSAPAGYHWDANLAMFQPDAEQPVNSFPPEQEHPVTDTPPPTSGQSAPPPVVAPEAGLRDCLNGAPT